MRMRRDDGETDGADDEDGDYSDDEDDDDDDGDVDDDDASADDGDGDGDGGAMTTMAMPVALSRASAFAKYVVPPVSRKSHKRGSVDARSITAS